MTKLLNLTSILCSSSRGKESRFHSWNVGTVTAQKCVSILTPPFHPPPGPIPTPFPANFCVSWPWWFPPNFCARNNSNFLPTQLCLAPGQWMDNFLSTVLIGLRRMFLLHQEILQYYSVKENPAALEKRCWIRNSWNHCSLERYNFNIL